MRQTAKRVITAPPFALGAVFAYIGSGMQWLGVPLVPNVFFFTAIPLMVPYIAVTTD